MNCEREHQIFYQLIRDNFIQLCYDLMSRVLIKISNDQYTVYAVIYLISRGQLHEILNSMLHD
jgi:hypothetical protein